MGASRIDTCRRSPALRYLGATLLGGVSLGAISAHATDGTWDGPGAEWTTGTNWSSTPTVPDGTATFTGNAPTALTISNSTSINTIQFNTGAPAYTFALGGAGGSPVFTIAGTGIVNNSSFAPTFSIAGTAGNNPSLSFTGAGTAANASFNVSSGQLLFAGTSTAGNATITQTDTSADQHGLIFFEGNATAGNATISVINNSGFGALDFEQNSTAGNATILVNGGFAVSFMDSSTAGNATVTISNGASVALEDLSTGGQATFIVNAGGDLNFGNSNGTDDDGKITAGSIAGAGEIELGTDQLTVGGNNLSTTVSGAISGGEGGGGSLVKVGTGTLTLDGVNIYTGLTDVQAGGLVVGDQGNPGASLGGAAMVETGAMLGGYGTINGNLANLGTVQPGGATPGTLTVTGTFTQSGTGNLLIGVTPSSISKLAVTGGATIGGTITIAFAPGTYAPGTSTFLTAASITDTSSHVFQNAPSGITASIVQEADPALALVLGGAGPAPMVVLPRDVSLFSAQDSALEKLALKTSETLLSEAALSGNRPNTCAQGIMPSLPGQAGSEANASTAATGLGNAFCGAGGWIHGDGSFLSEDGIGGNPSLEADTGGFLAGIDRPFGESGLRLGIAAGYSQTSLADGLGGTGTNDVFDIGVYGHLPTGHVAFDADLLVGFDWNTTQRATGVGSADESHSGTEVSGGVQASAPLAVGSNLSLTPAAGLRFAALNEGGFSESGATGFTLSGSGEDFSGVQPFLEADLSSRFTTDSQISIVPHIKVGYEYDSGAESVAVPLSGGFTSGPIKLNANSAEFGAGITAGKDAWTVFANYQADVAGNWHDQTVRAGIRVLF